MGAEPRDRIHRALSDDGTQVAGRVYGQGPPLVLLPAGPGDSETSWRGVLPFLSERFTCYLVDTRGRGLSADHPDHSPERPAQDIAAFVETIGEPVGLVEWGTAVWARVAAGGTDAVYAVAAYEPGVNEVMGEWVASGLEAAFSRVGELVASGRLVDAAQALVDNSEVMYTDEDLADDAPRDFWVASAPNLPTFLQEQEEARRAEQASSTDPSILAKITVPVLLLLGSRTRPWFVDSARHVALHVANPTVRHISGAAHFGPYTAPAAVARELIQFFTRSEAPT
jgi:pimeloyl-ACP methyl ester carboxylesterase